MNLSEMETLLRSRGCVMTLQRRAVLRFLDGNLDHPTAADVLAGVTREDPLASRATVYNTLLLLEESGAVRVVKDGDLARYDPNVSDHHHLHCTRCGRIEDVQAARVEVRVDGAVSAARVILEGECSGCRGAPGVARPAGARRPRG